MDKLIKLLNNYLIEKDISIYTFYWNQVFNCIHRGNGERCDKERICSKSFGFIKRLVENNKIDTKKVAEKRKEDGWSIVNYNHDEEQMTKETVIEYWVDNTLMALSISNSPIDDLILYLN